MIPKHKQVRLHGRALRDLVHAVYERDGHSCVLCGRWVQDGEKPHHEPPGTGRKSDELGKMVLLCNECHQVRHFGPGSNRARSLIEGYLAKAAGNEDNC